MSYISGASIALPAHSYTREELCSRTSNWLKDQPETRELFERFLSSSQIGRRSFAIPIEKILSLSSVEERAELFHEAGTALGIAAVRDLLATTGQRPASIESFIFSSCVRTTC